MALSCFGGLPPAIILYTRNESAATLDNASAESKAFGQNAVCLLKAPQKWAARPAVMTA